jgi:hypothetical protein
MLDDRFVKASESLETAILLTISTRGFVASGAVRAGVEIPGVLSN